MNVTDNWCPVALGLPAPADKGTYIEPASSGSCFSQRQVSVGLHWADQTPGSFPEVLTQNMVGACLAQSPGELSPKATPGHSHCQVSRVWRKKYKSTAIYFVSKLLSNGSSPLGNQTSRGRKKKKKHHTGDSICSSLRAFTIHTDFFAKLISPIAKKWRQKQVLPASQLLEALLARGFQQGMEPCDAPSVQTVRNSNKNHDSCSYRLTQKVLKSRTPSPHVKISVRTHSIRHIIPLD